MNHREVKPLYSRETGSFSEAVWSKEERFSAAWGDCSVSVNVSIVSVVREEAASCI